MLSAAPLINLPLVRAAQVGDFPTFKRLIEENNASLQTCDSQKNTLLHIVVNNHTITAIHYILARKDNIDVNARNFCGNTPLHLAAKWNDQNMVKKLIQAGANVNTRNHAGETPLHFAAKYGALSLITPLLQHGAQLCQPTREGKTPIDYAHMFKHPMVANAIIEYPYAISLTITHDDEDEPQYISSSPRLK